MCLAVPLRLIEISGDIGVVEMGGLRRRTNLSLVENPKVGDYLIVHAGFAISILDQQQAEETLDLITRCIEKADGSSPEKGEA
ncbi:MAG: HypC/HybG/HupF family hydrogenase formation chaperone [candidate division NC10 bacterium]|nr:HypC/HybG/HupF family hydrogenase formation chaperone [candidate division NC10 bacterium]